MHTQQPPNTPPNTGSGLSTPAQFRSKLGSYLSGVLIGFTLLGMIYLMKYIATNAPPASGVEQPVAAETEAQP